MMLNSSPDDFQSLKNQVAGSSRIIIDAQGFLYKRLDEQELTFYKKLHQTTNIQNWVPKFFGVISMEDDNINNSFELDDQHRTPWSQRMKEKEKEKAKQRAGKKEANDKLIMYKLTQLHNKLTHPDTDSDKIEKIHKRIKKLSDKRVELGCNQTQAARNNSGNKSKYIILENVAFGFQNPCVLDLKLGTRQHRDNAPVDKIARMIAKCNYTTSASLGIRLSGMQKYLKNGSYTIHDKYFGRRLTRNTLLDLLQDFFSPFRSLLPSIIQKLNQLKNDIKDEEGCYLYSSSLLFVIEGKQSDFQETNCEIRLIDFAHSYLYEHPGYDEGAVLGVNSLLSMLSQIENTCPTEKL